MFLVPPSCGLEEPVSSQSEVVEGLASPQSLCGTHRWDCLQGNEENTDQYQLKWNPPGCVVADDGDHMWSGGDALDSRTGNM